MNDRVVKQPSVIEFKYLKARLFVFLVAFFAINLCPAWAQEVHPHEPQMPLKTVKGKQTVYVCPMHRHIVQDHPGQCPICGMGLVPTDSQNSGISVDAATRQKLGVKLSKVTRKAITRDIHAYGTIAFDQSRVTRMNAKYAGWIRKLHVYEIGHHVREGDVIYEIYSPDLIQRQRDYLKLVERRNQLRKLLPSPEAKENETVMMLMQEALTGRQRLFYEDIDAQTISDIESNKEPLVVVPIKAPKDGVIIELVAGEGAYVKEMENVVTIAETSKLWVDIALYEDHVRGVRGGENVTVTARNGTVFTGQLRLVSPALNSQSRTLTARIDVTNPSYTLRPGEYVNAVVHTDRRQALVLPRNAVLRSGKGDFVMRHDGDGRFVPTFISTGIENNFWVEVKSGLTVGDEVATNGQFLLASEADIQEAAQRSTPTVTDAIQ